MTPSSPPGRGPKLPPHLSVRSDLPHFPAFSRYLPDEWERAQAGGDNLVCEIRSDKESALFCLRKDKIPAPARPMFDRAVIYTAASRADRPPDGYAWGKLKIRGAEAISIFPIDSALSPLMVGATILLG